MSYRWILASLCVMFALIMSPVLPAQGKTTTSTQTQPEIVKVGIYLMRAGSLDITTGAIDVDFYIDFTCDPACDKKQDKFEIVNGTLKSAVLLEDETSKFNPTYRASATVFQDVQLHKYPFDAHDLKIIIESSLYDSSALVYEKNVETTAIDPNVFILGWELDKKPTASIVDQYYEAWDLHYTRYEFKARLSKAPLSGWIKGLLPAIIIALGSLFALYITTKNVGNRVSIITSALVSSVLYHINFTSRVPAIGYLTYGDYFMLINYLTLLLSLVLTILIIRIDSAPDTTDKTDTTAPSKANKIALVNKYELICVPILWLGLHIFNYVKVIGF